MSVKKLKIGPGALSGAEVVSYLADAQSAGDYYTEDGTAPMNWLATPNANTLFALGDKVSRSKLRDLIEGVHPVTGQLIRRAGPDGTMVGALDVTVSPAPKSVSILWALGNNKLRYELEVLVGAAVDVAIGRMLDEQRLVRERYGPGPNDVRHVPAKEYVGAQVMHTAARLTDNNRKVPDPQLHVHNLLIGAVTPTGELRAIDSFAVLKYQAELEAEASGYLAAELQQRGFELERRLEERSKGRPRVAWEIKGVPPSLIQAMSRRSAEIEDLMEQYIKATGREPVGPGWDAFVSAQRGQKAKLSAPELRVEWQLEAADHGFGGHEVDVVLARADARGASGVRKPGPDGPEATEFMRLMLEYICRDHAFVPVAEMDRLAQQLAVGLLDPRTAERVVGHMVRDGDLLVTTDDKVTTLEVVAYEQRSRRAAEKLLAAPPGSPLADRLVEEELERRTADGGPLDEHQASAVRLAVSGHRLVSITGPAGTGKGYASKVMTALWHSQGRRVIAAAVPGRTAQQAAADADADESMTIDRLAYRLEDGRLKLGPEDVVLVDEASMVDHKRYARLLEAVASSEAILVQIGDDMQLSPIGPGGLWTVVHRLARDAERAAELRVVQRPHSEREAQAWKDLREGRAEAALAWIRNEGRLHLYETRPDLLTGMVETWWMGDRDGLMVVDTSNEERDRLNALAQAKRLEAGELGAAVVHLDNGRALRTGDRVLFCEIYRPRLPHARRVENGTRARVVNVDPTRGRAELELDELTPVRRLEVGSDAPIELGYARHVVKAQGVTAAAADLAIHWHTRRNELYVMGSRARSGARVHALTADVEAVTGVNPRQLPGHLDNVAESETAPASELPAGATWSANVCAAIAAERARREEVEAVTIREIARRAQRASTKEALGDRRMQTGRIWDAARQDVANRRELDSSERHRARERRTALRWERSWTSDRQEAPKAAVSAASRTHRLQQEPARSDTATEQSVEPLPAREAIESVARGRLHDMDTPGGLAFYAVAGRLLQAEDPAELAVSRWWSDRQAVIVVSDQEQDQRVRDAVARIQAASGPRGVSQGPATPDSAIVPEPLILQARAGYAARKERRERWLALDEDARQNRHLVEPGALPSAYVVAREPWSSPSLVRALSIAAESNLVVPSLHPGLASEVDAEAQRIHKALAAQQSQRLERQAALAHELACEPRPSEVHRTAELQADTLAPSIESS